MTPKELDELKASVELAWMHRARGYSLSLRQLSDLIALAERSTADVSALTEGESPAWLQALPEGDEAANFTGSAIVYTDDQLIEFGIKCGLAATAFTDRAITTISPMTDEQIISAVEDKIGHGQGAWDMGNPKDLAKAFREVLATAEAPIQQQPTLIAYVATDLDGRYDVGTTPEQAKQRAGHGCDTVFPIYDIGANATPPTPAVSQSQAAGDAVDAAMFRWLCQRDVTVEGIGFVCYAPELGHDGSNLRAQVAAAMREQP